MFRGVTSGSKTMAASTSWPRSRRAIARSSETATSVRRARRYRGSVSRRNLEDRPRGDPKDKIGLYNILKQAGTSSVEGRQDEAIAMAEQALAADPEIVEAHMLLGNFLKKAKRPRQAIDAYIALRDSNRTRTDSRRGPRGARRFHRTSSRRA